jgi:uncharacterized membrane protein YgaE (UPF0421/DUF939 family)
MVTEPTASIASRVAMLRAGAMPMLQTAVAAGAAWFVAHDLVGHRQPFFAPIAATIALGLAPGRRSRRAVEMAVGVAFGIAIGDLLVRQIGSGAIQIAIVVAVAMTGAILAGGGAILVSQSAASAILLVAFAPAGGGGLVPSRLFDALVGGAVGLLVVIAIPRHPLRVADAALDPVFGGLAGALDDAAEALERHDLPLAEAALLRARALDQQLAELRDAIEVAFETARIAPVWWRARLAVAADATAATHVDRAVRNARVLARAAIRAIDLKPSIPPETIAAVRSLAAGARLSRSALRTPGDEAAAIDALLTAAELGGHARTADHGLSVAAIVAQVRSIAVDLMRALGTDNDDAVRRVRRAGNRPST